MISHEWRRVARGAAVVRLCCGQTREKQENDPDYDGHAALMIALGPPLPFMLEAISGFCGGERTLISARKFFSNLCSTSKLRRALQTKLDPRNDSNPCRGRFRDLKLGVTVTQQRTTKVITG